MDSAYAKLSRAQKHLEELNASVKGYRNRDPIDFYRETAKHMFDPELMVIRIRVRLKEEPPGLEWSLIVGDILTNLRAALDHAIHNHVVTQAAITQTVLTAAQLYQLNYPIIADRLRWYGDPTAPSKNRKARDGVRKPIEPFLLPDVLDVVEKSQPFNASDPDWDGINVLNSLVNLDKHRTLRVVVYSTEEITPTNVGVQVDKLTLSDEAMVDGEMVGTALVKLPPQPQPQPFQRRSRMQAVPFNVNIGYIENIEIPTAGVKRSLLTVMDRLTSEVRTLLDKLKAAGC